ncbi:hypothetical protein ACJ73_00201 [Blastomyces percursus]|uniref:Uncharacterized protein n=1 Tax=Blastomyces percursus TaxID=1658174 RepID=A0A1J9QIT5_9EURO|nr:hypothetical protein ACJ73_00201 [Blastomyces percursus]
MSPANRRWRPATIMQTTLAPLLPRPRPSQATHGPGLIVSGMVSPGDGFWLHRLRPVRHGVAKHLIVLWRVGRIPQPASFIVRVSSRRSRGGNGNGRSGTQVGVQYSTFDDVLALAGLSKFPGGSFI